MRVNNCGKGRVHQGVPALKRRRGGWPLVAGVRGCCWASATKKRAGVWFAKGGKKAVVGLLVVGVCSRRRPGGKWRERWDGCGRGGKGVAIATNEMAGKDQKLVSSKNIISGRCSGGWALGWGGHVVGFPLMGFSVLRLRADAHRQTALPIFVGQEVSFESPALTGRTVAPIRIPG